MSNGDRIAMVFHKDKAYAVPDMDTLEHALEVMELVLYEKGELDLTIPLSAQLTARWGYLFPVPPTHEMFDEDPDPPEPPVWLTSAEASAWKQGWSLGYIAHKESTRA
jgi:hypothetical protein